MILKYINEHVSKIPGYKSEVKKLIKFIENYTPGLPFNNECTIRGITDENILDSAKHYVNHRKFKSKTQVVNYLEIAKLMFLDLFRQDPNLQNPTLKASLNGNIKDPESYAYKCKEYINNCDLLRDIESPEILSQNAADELSNYLDNLIEERKFLNTAIAFALNCQRLFQIKSNNTNYC